MECVPNYLVHSLANGVGLRIARGSAMIVSVTYVPFNGTGRVAWRLLLPVDDSHVRGVHGGVKARVES